MQTIQINGRSYSVTEGTGIEGEKTYTLTGKRGAQYQTMRNVRNPSMMFLIGGGGLGKPGDIWLTDRNGVLEAVRK